MKNVRNTYSFRRYATQNSATTLRLRPHRVADTLSGLSSSLATNFARLPLRFKFLVESAGVIGVALIIFAESSFVFFFPGDSLLFTAGILAAAGYMSLGLLLVLTFLAAILGNNIGYYFGRRIGPRLFTRDDSLFFRRVYLEKTGKFYEKYGGKTIMIARFVPVVRTFAPILAGVGNMPRRSFFLFNLAGGFVWTFGMTLLGYFLGKIVPGVDAYILPIVLAIIIASFIPGVYEWFRNRSGKTSSGI